MNRLNRTKGFISLRIASILSWIVLFVFINAVTLVSAAGEDASPSIPAPAGARGDAIIQPSAAFPSDTLLYLEINRVVESLDNLSRMELWPEARSMMASLVMASRHMHLPLGMFIDGMASWGIPSEFRTNMQVLAGKRLVVGWIPVTGSDRPVAVFVFQGSVPGDPVASLAWMVNRIDEASTLRSDSDRNSKHFWITAGSGKTLFVGRSVEGRLVFSKPSGYEAMETVAAALSPEGLKPPAPLSEAEDFMQTMSGLPEVPSARAYLNIPCLLERIPSWNLFSSAAKRMFKAAFECTGGIGIARQVEPGSIRSWVTGRILKDEMEVAFPGLLDSLTPIEQPLSPWLPASALFTYEVGAPIEKVVEALSSLIHSAAPWLGRAVDGQLETFNTSTGLDPATDFFPYLEKSLAVAVLPAEDDGGDWPFPRSVAMMEVKNREKVDQFLYEFFHWRASALAPFTGGLVSAMVVSEQHEGVELMGLKLDSIIDLPLPSPAFALVGDTLIISPVRSALKEAVSAVHGNVPRLTKATLLSGGTVQPDPVELIHLNLKSWEKEWNKWGETSVSACSLLVLDHEFVSKFQGKREWLYQMGQALFHMLGTMDRATGSTVMDDEGRFTFFIDLRLD